MTTGRRSFLRPLLVIVLVFGAVWAATILRWRADNRVPNGADIAVYLIVLPLVMLLAIWGGIKIFKAVKKRREKKADDAETPAVTEEKPSDPSLDWWLPLLACDALLPAGDSIDAVLEAATSDKRVDLHPRLKDTQGNPAYAAEVADLDIDAVRDSLPESAQGWNDARLRTLALAQTLATRMLDTLFDTLRPPTDPAHPMARKNAVAELEWWLPTSWDETARASAGQWLTGQLAAAGWTVPELTVQTRAMSAGDAALRRLDALNHSRHQPEAPVLPRLILAAESAIDETTLAEWNNQQALFASGHDEGRIPGEGAAALLLGAPDRDAPEAVARLHRVFSGRREYPVDAPRRPQADTFNALVKQAREHAPLPDDAELALVGDTDMRPSRGVEAMQLAEAALPETDPATALRPLGMANGDAGLALTLALVAAAVRLCADPQHAALVFSHTDPSQRLVAMVTAAANDSSSESAAETPSLQASET